MAYADPREYEEYAGFLEGEPRLEMFYIERRDGSTVVDYPSSLREMVVQWRHNAGQTIVWGADGRVSG